MPESEQEAREDPGCGGSEEEEVGDSECSGSNGDGGKRVGVFLNCDDDDEEAAAVAEEEEAASLIEASDGTRVEAGEVGAVGFPPLEVAKSDTAIPTLLVVRLRVPVPCPPSASAGSRAKATALRVLFLFLSNVTGDPDALPLPLPAPIPFNSSKSARNVPIVTRREGRLGSGREEKGGKVRKERPGRSTRQGTPTNLCFLSVPPFQTLISLFLFLSLSSLQLNLARSPGEKQNGISFVCRNRTNGSRISTSVGSAQSTKSETEISIHCAKQSNENR